MSYYLVLNLDSQSARERWIPYARCPFRGNQFLYTIGVMIVVIRLISTNEPILPIIFWNYNVEGIHWGNLPQQK